MTKPFWKQSRAYTAYRGIQNRWAFRAWARKNKEERQLIERNYANQRLNRRTQTV